MNEHFRCIACKGRGYHRSMSSPCVPCDGTGKEEVLDRIEANIIGAGVTCNPESTALIADMWTLLREVRRLRGELTKERTATCRMADALDHLAHNGA